MIREKITALLCALLLLFCAFALMNTRRTHDRMKERVRQTLAAIPPTEPSEGQAARTAQAVDDLCRAWERERRLVSTYSRHDELERVSEDMQRLRPLCESGDYGELRLKLHDIDASLDHLLDTELPTLTNIL